MFKNRLAMISQLSSSIALLVLASAVINLWHHHAAMAFTPPASLSTSSSMPIYHSMTHQNRCTISASSSTTRTSLSSSSSFFADATEPKKSTATTFTLSTLLKNNEDVVDNTAVTAEQTAIKPGDIVAISSSSFHTIKAYSVPKACYGSFHPTSREFIPVGQTSGKPPRSDSCLVLPTGLRGRVVEVYDAESLDRALPYLVKFEEGLDREEITGKRNESEVESGFNVPKAFAMHFRAEEIVLVDSL